MSDESGTPDATAETGTQQEGEAASFQVIGQYIKDFSFENPNAPRTLQRRDTAPQINVNINVNGHPLGEDAFLCELLIEAKAGGGDEMMFNVELTYAGILKIKNFPQEQINALVLIEGPRFLFPFAREIVAGATRQGGYPPLMLDPIDFVALYQRRVEEEKKKKMQPDSQPVN